MKSEVKQITVWKQPEFTMETVDGLVTYDNWCVIQLARLGRDTHYIEKREVVKKVKQMCIMRRDEDDTN